MSPGRAREDGHVSKSIELELEGPETGTEINPHDAQTYHRGPKKNHPTPWENPPFSQNDPASPQSYPPSRPDELPIGPE